MEHHKRRRGLDQPTRGSLSALDALIRETIEASRPPGDDEFTVDDYARGAEITTDAAYNRLRRKMRAGGITVRQVAIKGSLTNIYRVAD